MKGSHLFLLKENLLECLCCISLFNSPGIFKCSTRGSTFNLHLLSDCYLGWADGEELMCLSPIQRIGVPMGRTHTNVREMWQPRRAKTSHLQERWLLLKDPILNNEMQKLSKKIPQHQPYLSFQKHMHACESIPTQIDVCMLSFKYRYTHLVETLSCGY